MTESPRVLVVDDEPQIVRGLRVVLRNAGFHVDSAGTKEEALIVFLEVPPQLSLDAGLEREEEEARERLEAARFRPGTRS